jgi:hypothetical protein
MVSEAEEIWGLLEKNSPMQKIANTNKNTFFTCLFRVAIMISFYFMSQ